MAAIVGAAGLMPTLSAVRAGKRVLLANKEALVMAGQLFMDEVAAHGACLLSIDSEHNAIFQCMPQSKKGPSLDGINKILLTASGGPFLDLDPSSMHDVTPSKPVYTPTGKWGVKFRSTRRR